MKTKIITAIVLALTLVVILVGPAALAAAPEGSGYSGKGIMPRFSGPVIFGEPRIGGPFRGHRPLDLPTAQNVGSNVNVTANDQPQNETTIAINSNGVLAGGANDYRNGDGLVGAYYSANGMTWTNTVLKLPGGLNVGGDPSVAWGNDSTLYVGGLGFNRGGPSGAMDGSVLIWKAGSTGFTGNENATVVAAGSKSVFNDKPYIAAEGQNVYVTWTQFNMQGPFTTGYPIMFSHSTDGGTNFSTPVQISNSNTTQGSVPVKGSNNVYAVWQDFGSNSIRLNYSTDNGNTWQANDLKVADVNDIPSPLPGWNFRTDSFPSMGVIKGTPDQLFVVYASNPPGTDASDIFFTSSTDSGVTWSTPVKLNTDGQIGANQFFPWLAIGPDGEIDVVWYDTRDVGSGVNQEINLFFTYSDDGGNTWAPNLRISSQGFVPNANDQFGGQFIGDYNGVAASTGEAHPLWTGYRGQDQDIFYARVSKTPTTDIAVTAISAPASVAQGDTVSVDVTVSNVGNQDVSSDIDVTLTDTTDGIVIGSQTISGGLAPGYSTVLTYSWNTADATVGNHDLTATQEFTDGDAANDSLSTLVNVTTSTVVTVSGIDPNSMSSGATESVTITGSGFINGASVTFENGTGPAPTASNVQWVSSSEITATVVAKSGGPRGNRVWDVRVTNPDGSSGVLPGGFTVIR